MDKAWLGPIEQEKFIPSVSEGTKMLVQVLIWLRSVALRWTGIHVIGGIPVDVEGNIMSFEMEVNFFSERKPAIYEIMQAPVSFATVPKGYSALKFEEVLKNALDLGIV